MVSPAESRPIAGWKETLEQIDEAIRRRLSQVEEPATPASETGLSAVSPLQILDERASQMRSRLDRAERETADVDAALRAESEAYERWTENTTAARRRLADWTARAA